MIIPIRCFTCGKLIGNKYEWFVKEVKKEKGSNEPTILNVNSKTIQETIEGKKLTECGLTRYCCRRMILGHENLIDII